jgi:hypothetical protein
MLKGVHGHGPFDGFVELLQINDPVRRRMERKTLLIIEEVKSIYLL